VDVFLPPVPGGGKTAGPREKIPMNRSEILLSPKESRRLSVMEKVLEGSITISQAASLLNLSERHVLRLKGGMKKHGVAFLAHKNRGKKPKHAISEEIKKKIVSLALTDYKGASNQHFSELLEEYQDIKISPKSIGRILAQNHIQNPHSHKAAKKRRSRDRMPQEGLLVQCDASPFLWLEDRAPLLNLHGAIDDATGKILGLYFRPQEDSLGYMQILYQVCINYGLPVSLYSDRHTIFFSPNMDKLSIDDELAGKKVNLTNFGSILKDLNINHIPARSPQAKGRIERLWGTLQHRLVIELRIAGISTIEEANAFLPGFIARFNKRFAVLPENPIPAFRPSPSESKLYQIFSFREDRKASSGSSISFNRRTYQLVKDGVVQFLSPKAKVTVLTHMDGTLGALYKDQYYELKEFKQARKQFIEPVPKKPRKTYTPPLDHFWKQPSFNRIRSRPALSEYDLYILERDPSWRQEKEKLFYET